MKYKVGDKVKVRDDLVVGNFYGYYTYHGDMVNFRSKIVTIKTVGDYGFYRIEEDGQTGYWTAEMFEDDFEDDKEVSTSTEVEIAKFRAFLEEVANLDADDYDKEYAMLKDIVDCGYNAHYKDEYDYDEAVNGLCNFYRMFKPTEKRKMTKAEIEEELGYKIEIVEE